MASAVTKHLLPDSRKATAKPKERARGGEARAIADMLPAVGDTAFRKFGFVQSSVITRWPEIVGAKLARVTSPASLRFAKGARSDGTLHINVSGTHAVVVQHVLPDIIARVNRFFGYAAVAQVRLQQGHRVQPLAPPATAPAGRTASCDAAPPALSAAAQDILRTIKDPELRAVLDGLAHSLAKRDTLPKVR